MLGGGTFTVQNKVLPGAYINFISTARASANMTDRGIATIALELDWGTDNEVVEISNLEVKEKALRVFGYSWDHERLKGIRDLFLNIKIFYCYKLTSGGVKSVSVHGTAKCSGTRGNDLKVVVQTNILDNAKYDVKLMIGDILVDTQTVHTSTELIDNDFIVWDKTVTLELTAGTLLTGGTTAKVTGESHQAYLDKIEAYSFNTMGLLSGDDITKALYTAFTKRMREEVGAKFQTVLFNCSADYEGVVNVKNSTTTEGVPESSLVYWVTGISAGCLINKSNLNKSYDGEFDIDVNYTQTQLSKAILAGEFMLHRVGNDSRVLSDVTSLVTETDTKGEVFKDNQAIRVLDQIATDIAILFNTKYLGTIQNNEAGRIGLWADIVKHHEQLRDLNAIENFSDKDVVVGLGADKKAVVISDVITVVGTMAQIYMTVKVG